MSAGSGPTPFELTIGGLRFLHPPTPGCSVRPPEDRAYRTFVSYGCADEGPRDAIHVRLTFEPDPVFDGTTLCRSSAAWSILGHDAARAILCDGVASPASVVEFQPGSNQVLIRCSSRVFTPSALPCPIRYPLDQLLVMYLLGREGLIVHAAGMLVRGRGVVLAGVSGAGKSTFARLASTREGWTPLSDDRVIVRLSPSAASVWGTPWPGEGEIASNESSPLERLLFLEQGDEDSVRDLTPREALPRLLKTSSIPWYDSGYLGGTLEACGAVVCQVRSSVLIFRPDGGAADVVERLLDAG